MNLDATIVTDDPNQLPPDFQRLVDPQQPLPPEVRFFEERKTWRNLAQPGAARGRQPGLDPRGPAAHRGRPGADATHRRD